MKAVVLFPPKCLCDFVGLKTELPATALILFLILGGIILKGDPLRRSFESPMSTEVAVK